MDQSPRRVTRRDSALGLVFLTVPQPRSATIAFISSLTGWAAPRTQKSVFGSVGGPLWYFRQFPSPVPSRYLFTSSVQRRGPPCHPTVPSVEAVPSRYAPR